MKTITEISIAEDLIVIGWYDHSDHPVALHGTMLIPYDYAQGNPQLWEDFQEVIHDAQTLLDSAEAAYHATELRTKEMGKQ